MEKYVVLSLELHLFFARIMKEHSFFLEAGMVPKDEKFIERADYYKKEFEHFLCDVVEASNGLIRPMVLDSGEVVTDCTYDAERLTEKLSGIVIDSSITQKELKLVSRRNIAVTQNIVRQVRGFNRTAIKLLNGLIQLKEEILNNVLNCCMFTVNYPLLIEHILREAKLYRSYVVALENGQNIENQNKMQIQEFWNQIMMEHALFIRGLLDPTEEDLIQTSNQFAKDYAELLCEDGMNRETEKLTREIRDFKKAGTEGLVSCEIRSIILPLLGDHVLREANHYLRLLKMQ
ncbi:MAG: DUF2935 domain-containing protein [Clostridiales bacterium]|nr:DUF2935 domain-containing protein [Clostridiales bacterium]